MINIVYDSKTGNVERFINKIKNLTDWKFTKIEKDLVISTPYHLITYTTGIGHVPNKTAAFIKDNAAVLLSISASGNRNWGNNFALSADTISKQYNIPTILKFELSGTSREVQSFITLIKNINTHGEPESLDFT